LLTVAPEISVPIRTPDGGSSASIGLPVPSYVVVANRLPYSRAADGSWKLSPGGLVSAVLPSVVGRDAMWIGSHGDAEGMPARRDGIRLVPVSVSADEQTGFYDGFSNGTLWPLYHDAVRPPCYDPAWWSDYEVVNRRFAETTARHAPRGALVWVHDYQLQLVPAMLRALRPDVRIGYFHHIPFPNADLFRQIPWRCEIISGLAGADIIGFQTAGDVTNFLGAALSLCDHTVSELSAERGELRVGSRVVSVAAFPVPVDAASFEARSREPRVHSRAAELRQLLGGPRNLLLGVDRLDYTKGIDQRLAVVRSLFEGGVLVPGRDVFLQVAVPSRADANGYSELRCEVERLVGDINGEFAGVGAAVVHYLHRSLDPEELTALYQAADVMIVTPFRDGMNLVAKEFIASRTTNSGALVLSEFAGAAAELAQAFLVNPHDLRSMATAIEEALGRTSEAEESMRAMRANIADQSPKQWATDYFRLLEGSR
jgi:trehalose 6-phosphate synthase